MCYYNGVKVPKTEFIRLKQLERAVAKLNLNRPVQIGFQYQAAPVLKKIDGEANFDIVEMEWGFIPRYWKNREEVTKWRNGFMEEGKFKQMITLNAVSEELLLPNKVYREAALKRRCLVLSTGFYEWQHVFPIGKRTGKPLKTAVKYPYHINLKNQEYFYMAGIWQPWTDQSTGEYVESFSIITTSANRLMEQVHNSKRRMPTILNDDLAYEWLMEDLSEERIKEIARHQYPANQMQACTIAKDFLSALEPAEPFQYEDLPALDLNFG